MSTRLKWKTDIEKTVVTLNFERRGWQRSDDENVQGKYTDIKYVNSCRKKRSTSNVMRISLVLHLY